MSRKKRTMDLHVGLIIVLFVGGFAFLSWWAWAAKPYSAAGQSERFTVSSGTTTTQLAAQLEEGHLIRSALVFRYLVRTHQNSFKVYAGDYLLSSAMSPDEIMQRLNNGAALLPDNRVTIPEGFTTEQIIDLLVRKGIGSKEDFIKVITDDEFPYTFLKGAPKGIHRLEGYLSPNTYYIDKNTNPHAVIDMFLQQSVKEITPDVQKQLTAMKLTVPQWVTLGSIVEKEAEKESDRPLIASVFFNRLKINKPLQSCATIQFILGDPKPKLYDKDLKIPSPYNTYLHAGLPPGPIANPGHAALQAVLHPAKTDYFYFVAKKDGYHAFAKTYQEHLNNIKLYQS